MGTSICLFSRARPGKPTTRKIRGFLALPGEIRNMVYEYYIQPDFRCEFAAKGYCFKQAKSRTVKLLPNVHRTSHLYKDSTKPEEYGPTVIRISRPLGKYNVVQGLQTNWLASIYTLNLVCKQIHAETQEFLYQKTVFVFESPKRLTNFLTFISKPKLATITKLQLHYSTYGAPKSLDDLVWQEKHTKSWTRACSTASKKLLSLQELGFWVKVNHRPLRFNLHENWVKPLLQFRRLIRTPKLADGTKLSNSLAEQQKKLEIVNVHIETCWSRNSVVSFNHNKELARASSDLHLLFGRAVSLAILGAKEGEAMAEFNTAWRVTHQIWQYHLGFAKINW